MSTERVLTVRIRPSDVPKFELLRRQADHTAERLAASDYGDQTEVVRYEHLMAEIEALGWAALNDTSQHSQATHSVALPWPFEAGPTPFTPGTNHHAPPADTWQSKNQRASRTEATRERFVQQLEAWVGNGASAKTPPLCPSDVQNRALTEALRTFAAGTSVVNAAVTYRDGSSARPFPLRSVQIDPVEPDDGRETLRFTLLSVRHVEMDVDVDGAWLRNRHISLPRPAGQTDELAYQQSLEQFAVISAGAPVTIHLYQTGLAAANMGFYRALIDHHRKRGANPVAVIPFYYAGDNGYARSRAPWVITP